MRQLVASGSALTIEAANKILLTAGSWPEPASGLASRIFKRAGTSAPTWMSQPLRQTSASLLRRTPEIAAFGYVLDRADSATQVLWADAIEHLRGREIFPPDRQSFIFNPIEILGIAFGVAFASVPIEHREWFATTIRRGISQGQFRTALSQQAAQAALRVVASTEKDQKVAMPDHEALGTADLIVHASMCLAVGKRATGEELSLQHSLVLRMLAEPISIGDTADAAAVVTLLKKAMDRVSLLSADTGVEDRIVAICRRFPLFVEQLQTRQRRRAPFAVDDEYDVQDLLHGILKLHFEDVRPEEHTPSYAGNSSRVDFYLARERIVVEAKMTRHNLGQREVANQLAIDAARYAQMPAVDTLICLVYDPDRHCTNPVSLERDLETSGGRIAVRAVVCPHGL